ncbi:MAG: hypothetical protein FJZ01_16885 [Candidatus Sericytochromatia bacterium]|nr:hypothetical protein [Candidatus Tanganyikabacteria bacterium]
MATLLVSFALSACGVSYPQGAPGKTAANPVVQASSLKSDLVALLDRLLAQDDVMTAEANKATTTADKLRFTKQAYLGLFSATTQVQERADDLNLNPFEAKKRKLILDETASSLWKLRYLEKEGAAKAKDDQARLDLYERLHTDALQSLNRVRDILNGRG